jgi:hypothetical protein
MFRPNFGMKLAAVAIGVVTTAGVAAAATITTSPAAHVALAPEVEADVPAVPTGLPDTGLPVPGLSDLSDLTGFLGSLPSLPSVPSTPSVPSLPSLPGVPGVGSLPVDPTGIAAGASEAVTQVVALLPTPEELQAVVMGCVSDLTALSPVPTPGAGDPIGAILGLFGMLGNLGGGGLPATPPSPAAVQAAVTDCVTSVLGLLPDPGALAAALTDAFGGDLPGPMTSVVAVLMGEAGGLPDAQHLLDLVSALTSATGSPTAVLQELTGVLESVLPPQVAGLLALPLGIIDQVFATIGLA